MHFLIDAQLPPGLVAHLEAGGMTAEHVNRIGLGSAGDAAIWKHAARTGAVLMTKDEDFVAMAKRTRTGPQVVWIRVGNIANEALWRALSASLGEILESLRSGERVVEVV